MQTTEANPEPSKFDVSLARLRAHLPDTPAGWRTILARAIRRLAAVRAEDRDGISFVPVRSNDGRLYIVAAGKDDSVVDGILRKLTRISGCTCSKCGRQGRAYAVDEVDGAGETLCPACAAPIVLRYELCAWLRALQAPGTVHHQFKAEIHPAVRALIPQDKWETFGPAGRKLEYLAGSTVWEMKADFERVALALAE